MPRHCVSAPPRHSVSLLIRNLLGLAYTPSFRKSHLRHSVGLLIRNLHGLAYPPSFRWSFDTESPWVGSVVIEILNQVQDDDEGSG